MLTMEMIQQALEAGFTSVMLDASRQPFAENVRLTKEVAARAAAYGATVEAELGLVGGSEDGKGGQGVRCTDPAQAAEFVSLTGIDALAVAIGNAHGDYPAAPHLAFNVLEQIQRNTDIPLVLHGGSGISDIDFQHAISLGIRKVNIATASFHAAADAAAGSLNGKERPDYFALSEAMTEGVCRNVARHIRVFNTPYSPTKTA